MCNVQCERSLSGSPNASLMALYLSLCSSQANLVLNSCPAGSLCGPHCVAPTVRPLSHPVGALLLLMLGHLEPPTAGPAKEEEEHESKKTHIMSVMQPY